MRKNLKKIFFKTVFISLFIILIIFGALAYLLSHYTKITPQIKQANQIIESAFTKWTEYQSDYFTVKYPENWGLETWELLPSQIDKNHFFAYNPKEAYRTSSRPPKIYGHYLEIIYADPYKSATQYVDEEFAARVEAKRYAKEAYKREKNENPYAKDYSEIGYPLYWGREDIIRGNIQYVLYKGKWSDATSFAISNGKILLIGSGRFNHLNDGSIEAQIINSLTFK